MKKINIRTLLLTVLDILIIVLSYIMAYLLRFDFKIDDQNIQYLFAIFRGIPVIIIIQIGTFFLFGVMRSLWKYISIEETIRIGISVVFSTILSFLLINMTRFQIIPRSSYVFGCVLIIFGTVGIRALYRYLRTKRNIEAKEFNAVIIGAGDAGYLLAKEIISNNKYLDKVVGYIDDNIGKVGRTINGIRILGTCEKLPEIVIKYNINHAYIAIPSASKDELKRILNACQEINLKVMIMNITEVNNQVKPSLRDVSIEDLLGRGEIKLNNDEIGEYITDQTVLVTGAGGSIGSELCRQILKFNPKRLVCLDIYENGMYDLQQEIEILRRKNKLRIDSEMICLIGSVKDKDRINEIMKTYQPSTVFHAAAHKHVPLVEDSPKEAIKNNVLGTYNMVNYCIKYKVKKMILISTDKAVNPTNVMGATKRMCELIIQAYRNNGITKLCAVRFGNVLGSNGSVIPLFKKQIENGGPITVTDKEITRYFMTIPEATQLVLQAGYYAKQGDIFVLDMGSPVKIAKLAEDLIKLSGLRPYEDIEIQYVGLRPGEKMYEELSLGDETRHKTENDLIFINEPMDIDKEIVENKIVLLKNVIEENIPICELKERIIQISNINID